MFKATIRVIVSAIRVGYYAGYCEHKIKYRQTGGSERQALNAVVLDRAAENLDPEIYTLWGWGWKLDAERESKTYVLDKRTDRYMPSARAVCYLLHRPATMTALVRCVTCVACDTAQLVYTVLCRNSQH